MAQTRLYLILNLILLSIHIDGNIFILEKVKKQSEMNLANICLKEKSIFGPFSLH